ncbi:MAG: helix-turn-helix transcriptional regulator [Lachnospiraceae bacterium]|nr:helix-turn-helix transcriptional regulator [Lachnospiraceae bacterium]
MQTHLVLTDFLTRLVKCITNKSVKPPKYILQIKELFDSAYYTNHTLEELEHEFQITRYRICRDFNQHFHISPIQYLHQVRIQNAQLLLQEGNMKIHEIAYEVGYENVNHFIHHFKKTAGITPAAYRKTLMTS